MLFRTMLIALITVPFLSAPSRAQNAQVNLETCEFDANGLKLAGAERKKFMARCAAYEKRANEQARRIPLPRPAPKPGFAR